MIDIHTWDDESRCVLNSALHLALVYADEMPTCFPSDLDEDDDPIDLICLSECIIREILKTDIIHDEHIMHCVNALSATYDLLHDTECSEATAITSAAYGLPPQWSLNTYLTKLCRVIVVLTPKA